MSLLTLLTKKELKNPGKIYLIPNYLSDSQSKQYIPDIVCNTIKQLKYFLVENVRTSRRFISSLQLDIDISQLIFEVMDKRFDSNRLPEIFEPVFDGVDLGIQSEAGLPGIADPGGQAVAYAHQHGISVVTLPGSSSIITGLISSGFNGQQFAFHGYLPIDKQSKIAVLKRLENEADKTGYSQLFMETPYRNTELFNLMLNHLKPQTLLFIGKDLTGDQESAKTFSIDQWKKEKVDISKVPVIFAIGNFKLPL